MFQIRVETWHLNAMHNPEFHPGWIKIAMKNITMRTDEILI